MNQENNNALVTPAPAVLSGDAVWNGKCRPIPYSTPMIKAKREGIKDMTRRTRGLKTINENPNDWMLLNDIFAAETDMETGIGNFYAGFKNKKTGATIEIKCPYGRVGDGLWIKETWAVNKMFDRIKPSALKSHPQVIYRADNLGATELLTKGKWRPGMFMPRWASRMTDEIVAIRCERLQDITTSDCVAEGIKVDPFNDDKDMRTWKSAYLKLWDKINGKKLPWTVNPWLWVLSTKPIDYNNAKENKQDNQKAGIQ